VSARRAVVAALLAVVLTGSLSACSGGSVSLTAGPTAAAVPAAGASLSPADFAAATKVAGTVLLDVRTPAEFTQGHLPGAVNLDVESAGFVAGLASLDKTAPYAVYCRSGNRSKVALTAMAQAGFGTAFDLAGGISAWKSAGGEVVTG
jgi:rhodanese-related sulfurtransferase